MSLYFDRLLAKMFLKASHAALSPIWREEMTFARNIVGFILKPNTLQNKSDIPSIFL